MLQEALTRIRYVAETLEADDPDKLEMLNIEGDYNSLIEWALKKRNEYCQLAEGTKTLISDYSIRKARFEKKADSMKDIIGVILNTAGETKYTGPLATVTVKAVPPKPIITDENLVPDTYKKTTVSIDKTAINEAVKEGKTIMGVAMDNGGQTIQIRVK